MDPLFLLLPAGAFFAGLVDAVVGGGGLIQIPLLFSAFPNATPATLFGTNKLASVVGTTSAAIHYGRRITIPWPIVGPAAAAAAIGAWLGARAVSLFPPVALRPLILALLIAVAIYTFIRKDFGIHHQRLSNPRRELRLAVAIGAGIGFYDGFFGPGTGSFLIFLFIRFFGLDFMRASASAKVVNIATNLAALSFFVPTGHVLWAFALPMAAANVGGAVVGTRLALRGGTAFIRRLFVLLVLVLIAKMTWDMFAG